MAKDVYAAAAAVEPRTEYWSVAFAPRESGLLGTSWCCPSPVERQQIQLVGTQLRKLEAHQEAQKRGGPCSASGSRRSVAVDATSSVFAARLEGERLRQSRGKTECPHRGRDMVGGRWCAVTLGAEAEGEAAGLHVALASHLGRPRRKLLRHTSGQELQMIPVISAREEWGHSKIVCGGRQVWKELQGHACMLACMHVNAGHRLHAHQFTLLTYRDTRVY